MANVTDLTTAFFAIVKADRNADGTMMVYGKATDDSLDIDQQICDSDWLNRAMPDWFKTGGNIREQHSNIAAGVAKEYEQKTDGHYIHALIVDPTSVKKVDTGVLKGFSIGIKGPRVVRDDKAANGRIIDGQIVEVSLVDRPANPNCQLILAKSVSGEENLVAVEELIEEVTKEDETAEVVFTTETPAEEVTEEVVEEVTAEEEVVGNKSLKVLGLAKTIATLTADITKFDKAQYEIACAALAELIIIEAGEMKEGHNEILSIQHLLEAVAHLHMWYQGEVAEGEVVEAIAEEGIKMSHTPKKTLGKHDLYQGKDETPDDFKKRCMKDGESDLDFKKRCGAYKDKMKDLEEKESHKSAEEEVANEVTEVATEVVTEVSAEISTEDIEAIVEKAVLSATNSVRSEVALLLSAKEAAENKATTLEGELARAKSLAVGGGPKRTLKPIDTNGNDLLTKALVYKAKANASTDPTLVIGYKALAKEFFDKAESLESK